MSIKCRLILASASPRRRQFLKDLNIAFDVCVSGVPEQHIPSESPQEYVKRNAETKALASCEMLSNTQERSLVLGADTIVLSPDNEILEKPQNYEDAGRMLRLLSGRWHSVLSGFSIIDATTKYILHSEIVTTKVRFRHISDEELHGYIASGEASDKAGAYGIQGLACAFVTGIEGSYTNVVGLPICEVLEALKKHAGLSLFS